MLIFLSLLVLAPNLSAAILRPAFSVGQFIPINDGLYGIEESPSNVKVTNLRQIDVQYKKFEFQYVIASGFYDTDRNSLHVEMLTLQELHVARCCSNDDFRLKVLVTPGAGPDIYGGTLQTKEGKVSLVCWRERAFSLPGTPPSQHPYSPLQCFGPRNLDTYWQVRDMGKQMNILLTDRSGRIEEKNVLDCN